MTSAIASYPRLGTGKDTAVGVGEGVGIGVLVGVGGGGPTAG